MKWISVKEQIPELNRDVIILYKDGNREHVTAGTRRELNWLAYRWSVIVDNSKVTNWMPLPTPPTT